MTSHRLIDVSYMTSLATSSESHDARLRDDAITRVTWCRQYSLGVNLAASDFWSVHLYFFDWISSRIENCEIFTIFNPELYFFSVSFTCTNDYYDIDRVSSAEGNAIASICLSVRPFVSTLTFEPRDLWPWPFACVWVMTIALMGLMDKVRDQG